MKPYVQKDLGYPRAATTAMLRVTMPDLSEWDVPAQIIADNRDLEYRAEKIDSVKEVREHEIGKTYLIDWAENNMNWSEVEPYARRVESAAQVDFQDGWVNGEKAFIGQI